MTGQSEIVDQMSCILQVLFTRQSFPILLIYKWKFRLSCTSQKFFDIHTFEPILNPVSIFPTASSNTVRITPFMFVLFSDAWWFENHLQLSPIFIPIFNQSYRLLGRRTVTPHVLLKPFVFGKFPRLASGLAGWLAAGC